jgi:uncharacterized protein YndB with AHSA1/START domain
MSAIVTDSFLPHPPEKVWRALTESALIARWLMPNDFVPEVGHLFTFTTRPVPGQRFDGVVHCEVLALRPPTELSISWRGGSLDSTVTWRLEPEGIGTRLFLAHDGFDDDDPSQEITKRTLGSGWSGHMAARLDDVLASM